MSVVDKFYGIARVHKAAVFLFRIELKLKKSVGKNKEVDPDVCYIRLLSKHTPVIITRGCVMGFLFLLSFL